MGRILVVDDDEAMREFLTTALAAAGYSVSTARDGAEALHLARGATERPDLFLVDLAMPNMSGLELLHELRACDETQYVPVLVVTGLDEVCSAAVCLDDGANDFIQKPVAANTLVARVRRHLSVYRQSQHWRSQSCEDELTHLLTRWAFKDSMAREIGRAVRRAGALSVVFVDVDAFKAINDEIGHAAGDTALTCVADAFRRVLRRCDVAARWGGDEFVIALPGASRATACGVVARLRREAARLSRNRLGISVRLSAGVSCLFEDACPGDRDVIAALVDAADRAMYHDKRAAAERRWSADEAGTGNGRRVWG